MPSLSFSIPVTLTSHSFFEKSQHSVHFLQLDTTVSLENNQLKMTRYCKLTESHNCLLYSSAHPRKCKDSIPYSQYVWIRRSTLSYYDRHLETMTLHFLYRGYPIDLLQESAIKARRLNQDSLLRPQLSSTETTNDRSIMVTTFHQSDDSPQWVVKKNWSILGKSHSNLPFYNRKLLTAYRRPRITWTSWFGQTAKSNPVIKRIQSCSLSLIHKGLPPALVPTKPQSQSFSRNVSSLAVVL